MIVINIPVFKSKDGTDMLFRNSRAARNPIQGLCNVLQCIVRLVISRLYREKEVFLKAFDLPKCMVVGFLMVEELFSLLLY